MTNPKRLLDPNSGADPELQMLLRIARSELPYRDELDRLEQHLSVAVGAMAAGGSAAAGTPVGGAVSKGALSAGTVVKAGAAVTLVVAAAGTGAVAIQRERRTTTTPSAPAYVILQQTEPAAKPAPILATARVLSQTMPAASVDAPDVPETAAARPAGRPTPTVEPMSHGFEPQRTEELARSLDTQPRASPESEVSLLQRAADAVAMAPELALRLTDDDARDHPAGALAQEREFIAIQALLGLGKRSEARVRADQFFHDFPGSAHLPRIAALVREASEQSVHNSEHEGPLSR